MIDLAPLVGANLEVMEADALRMRVKRPFIRAADVNADYTICPEPSDTLPL